MINSKDLREFREEYSGQFLDKQNTLTDPFAQFQKWFEEALQKQVPEPNAMALATVSNTGPAVRMVLMKGFDNKGFRFFSNYESRKAKDLLQNPKAALCFYWHDLNKQVRVEGDVERVSEQESLEYFRSRPRNSQIGAWASPQSCEIDSSEILQENFQRYQQKFPQEVPLPPNWGGYLLIPRRFEFWQGQPSRLHNRIVYVLQGNDWNKIQLAP